ncbi:hypothetical protein INT47_000930 [Mucor saturninus]|uniref:Uncharacterized protein n=1 Tax=Mucor saturninus TaxID=64648 RepID=A0A8H7VH65_9FUNG|nr:hypothetical protein INT47_000930 [Mucor saturninus]
MYLPNLTQRLNLLLPQFEHVARLTIDSMIEHRNTSQSLHSLERRSDEALTFDPNKSLQLLTFSTNAPQNTSESFWSHLFSRVCRDPQNLSAMVNYEQCILDNVERFNQIRQRQDDANENLDEHPELDSVKYGLSKTFAATAVQNVGMHLLNFNLWIIRVFAAFLNHHQTRVNQRVTVKTIAPSNSSTDFDTLLSNIHKLKRQQCTLNEPELEELTSFNH